MTEQASLYYHPEVSVKAVLELTAALKDKAQRDYANALLSDPRMTNTKGHMASCGVSYRDIKLVRCAVPGHLPPLATQRKAIEFLNTLDKEQGAING